MVSVMGMRNRISHRGSGCSLGLPIFEAKQSVTKAIRDDEPEIKNVQDSPTIDRSQASEGMPG